MAKENIFKRAWTSMSGSTESQEVEERSINVGPTNAYALPYGFSTTPVSTSSAMQLSAVYRCVEVISDSIASQTWEVTEYQKDEGFVMTPFHKASYMLNYEPNPNMSRFTIMKTLISKVLLEGNGYLIIRRNGIGDPIRLDLVTGDVTIYKRESGAIYYEIKYSGYDTEDHTQTKKEIVASEDMIHILNYSYDGIQGVSTLRHAANTMEVATASESSAKGFFRSGANMSGILTVQGGIDDKKEPTGGKLPMTRAQELKNSWSQTFNVTDGTPGGIVVLEDGVEFQPVTVNMKDAQMLETRQFNVVEICRYFGVSPSKVFDSANLTYSNIESFQLGFITDTISPLDAKIEAEFNRKLLRPSQRLHTRLKLNIEELLRSDLDSTANYYAKMLGVGAYTPNEIRTNIGQPKVKGGDKSFVPMNFIAVDAPVTKNTKVDKQIDVKEEVVEEIEPENK